MTRPLAYLPSPTQSVWHLGPLPIHAYALCIVAGILVALRVADNRWRAVGGRDGDMWDVSGWAIVLGIIGGRLYHVVSDPELYFHANHILGLRLKNWTSIVVFLIGIGLVLARRDQHHDTPYRVHRQSRAAHTT